MASREATVDEGFLGRPAGKDRNLTRLEKQFLCRPDFSPLGKGAGRALLPRLQHAILFEGATVV